MTSDTAAKKGSCSLQDPLLSVIGIRKNFGGVRAVQNCSLSIPAGKITSIIGPNGAGKTTLFNIIAGIVKPDAGVILFEGKNLAGYAPHDIARAGVSRTFQSSKVFKNLTIRDNLLLAKKTTDAELLHMLKRVRCTRGLDTLAGELSYGQQRLVEIARALLLPHTLLMLDEPAAGVNPHVRQEIATILRELKQNGGTVILIEHDMDFVMGVSDNVIVINQGTVLAKGSPEHIRENKAVLEAYLGN